MDYEQLRECGSRIRLVISDMDGTLLDSRKNITNRTRAAVERLKGHGIAFTICTGRIPTMAEYYIRELEIDIPIVAANGAIVWDSKRKEPIWEKAMPTGETEELMDVCRSLQLDYSALTLEGCYFSPNSIRMAHFVRYNEIAEKNGYPMMELQYFHKNHDNVKGRKIYKLLIYEQEPGKQEQAVELIKKFPGLTYTSSDAGLWDVSALGVSKGRGLKQLSDILQIGKEEICAFGDYYNDVSMLSEAALPVAMGNGCDKIKEAAVYITESNDCDGVAQVIEDMILQHM